MVSLSHNVNSSLALSNILFIRAIREIRGSKYCLSQSAPSAQSAVNNLLFLADNPLDILTRHGLARIVEDLLCGTVLYQLPHVEEDHVVGEPSCLA